MRYVADLHIHSRYSRATSKTSHLHGLAAWAQIKGIDVIGTGDFTHPHWYQSLQENLVEAEPGFFKLKSSHDENLTDIVPPGILPQTNKIRFVLTAEISSIYKRHDIVRKVHNIVFAPDFDSVARINSTLAGIGNIESDGRPILGLDSKNLLEIVLEKAPDGFLVPAHIWTPWFSLFGSKSGFDSIEECFADLSAYIFALETGLSSDPDMNRCISALDRFSLISNSDCHSPAKLGREANIFNTDFDFYAMTEALRSPTDAAGRQQFEATIEFFPEEGKYHCDGHRKCGVCLEPYQTHENSGICPKCGRPVTVGVLNRVMELADREQPVYPKGSPGVYSLIPLVEVLSELLGTGPATKKVSAAYAKLICEFGSEFALLLKAPIDEIGQRSSLILAEAIKRIREKNVVRTPGYDGEFGIIKVFSEAEKQQFGGQMNLFGIKPAPPRKRKTSLKNNPKQTAAKSTKKKDPVKKKLNLEQQAIVDSDAVKIIVKAGPGTGKTHTLVASVAKKIRQTDSPITVITFTNKAAEEVDKRLRGSLGDLSRVFVGTFHAFCLKWLRESFSELQVAGPEKRLWLLKSICSNKKSADLGELEKEISLFFRNTETPLFMTKMPKR